MAWFLLHHETFYMSDIVIKSIVFHDLSWLFFRWRSYKLDALYFGNIVQIVLGFLLLLIFANFAWTLMMIDETLKSFEKIDMSVDWSKTYPRYSS